MFFIFFAIISIWSSDVHAQWIGWNTNPTQYYNGSQVQAFPQPSQPQADSNVATYRWKEGQGWVKENPSMEGPNVIGPSGPINFPRDLRRSGDPRVKPVQAGGNAIYNARAIERKAQPASPVPAVTSDPVVEQFCQAIPPAAVQRMVSMPQGRYAAWWPEFYEDNSSGRRKFYAAIMCSSNLLHVEDGGNCVIDLETGETKAGPGKFDGQWVKGLEASPIYTVPNKFNEAMQGVNPGLTFYNYSDVWERGEKAKPIFRDPSFGNHYHSFGLVERGQNADGSSFAISRAMNDKWGVSIHDYKINLDAKGKVLNIEPYGGERNLTNESEDTEVVRKSPADNADPNPHNSYFDLPMISQDGKYFAANNRRTMTTQIFEITPAGKRLVADLGIETGKVSFAPQKSNSNDLLIAFHVDQIDPAEGDKMSGVHDGMTKDIVVQRLIARKDLSGQIVFDNGLVARVTDARHIGDGNYYPKWINDHELIYVESRNYNRQTFVKVDVNQIQLKSNLMPRPSYPMRDKQYAATTALGYYVARVCTDYSRQLTAKESAQFSVMLSKDHCRQLAKSWDEWKFIMRESPELAVIRPPKTPGYQRRSGWNFHESRSQRGSERLERTVSMEELSAITSSDLNAVCDLLK